MQLFLIAFQQPIPFGISAIIVITMIGIILKSALSAEGGVPLGPRDHEPEREVPVRVPVHVAFFFFFFRFWVGCRVSGSACSSSRTPGANSPYGGIGLIALFSGFFIMMGFLWAVIGE